MKLESRVAELMRTLDSGDELGALRIAAKFKHPMPAVSRAWAAHQNPDFYRQIGEDPHALLSAAIVAIRAKYGVAE